MIVKPWTAGERAQILRSLAELRARRQDALEREEWDLADALKVQVDEKKLAYRDGLPRLVMGCCPFDGEALVRTFDPMGLDGLWWEPDYATEELPTCPHFCVLGGAVNYQGLQPRAGNTEIFPGPEIPFVYPRLLGLPGVVAVISSLPMDNGYLAYPIAYFAEKRPPGEQLVAGWRNAHHTWRSQLGVYGERVENDKWDFDLGPWLQQGKIRWTAPGSDRTVLADGAWESCPFLDLKGEHMAVGIYQDKFGYDDPPDGSAISPYDD